MRGLLKLLLRGCAGLLGITLKVIIEAATQLRWIVRIIGNFLESLEHFVLLQPYFLICILNLLTSLQE